MKVLKLKTVILSWLVTLVVGLGMGVYLNHFQDKRLYERAFNKGYEWALYMNGIEDAN